MVASWYSSSTGAGVRPSRTSSAGSTPDSRSRIIQPSVRTVSLTQNGIRHSMNSSERRRPRASLAMVQAIGNASSSVQRGGDDRHHRRAHEGVPVQRLVEEGAVLAQARLRSRAARRVRAATARPGRRAAARSGRPATAAPAPAAAAAAAARAARPARSGMRRRRGEAHRALRIEAEGDCLADAQIGEPPGLRQRDAQLGAAGWLRAAAPPNSRRRTAGFPPAARSAAGRPAARPALRARLATSGRTNASTASPAADRADAPRVQRRSRCALVSVDRVAVDARVMRPAKRLLAPTKPATNGVCGS